MVADRHLSDMMMSQSETILTLSQRTSKHNSPFKILLVGLCLVSCLISIKCASLKDHLKETHEDDTNLDSLIDQWAQSPVSEISYKALPSEPSSFNDDIEQQQQPNYYQPSTLLEGLDELTPIERQKLYNQLLLASPEIKDNLSPSRLASNNRYAVLQQQQQYAPLDSYIPSDSIISNDLYSPTSNEESIFASVAKSRYGSPSSDGGRNKNYNRHMLDDYQFLLEPNSKQQTISIYQPVEESSNKLEDGQISLLEPDGSQNLKNFVYKTTTNESNKRSEANSVDQEQVLPQEKRNLTTLIEDDDDDEHDGELGDKDKSTNEKIKQETTTELPAETTTTITYGKVLTGSEDKQPDEVETNPHSLLRFTSVFSNLYNLLADSWPASLSITKKKLSKIADNQKGNSTIDESIDNKNSSVLDNETIAKLGVSRLADNSKEQDSNQEDQSKQQATSNKLVVANSVNDDKQSRGRSSAGNESSSPEDDAEPKQETKIVSDGASGGSSERMIRNEGTIIEQRSEGERQQQLRSVPIGGHKISLLRQSSLEMPFKSNDELVVESSGNIEHPTSLLGKYIYAPEHHYHLSTSSSFGNPRHVVLNDVDNDDANDNQMFAKMPQRSFPRNIHAGDDVFGSFSNLRPIYSAAHLSAAEGQNDRLGLIPNKSNDIYFLVMVGAFCVMAMTLVLTAGLFAYRIQQNRKSSTEADYPTYGVVGPNNMNGKCGAASFVGGYFSGMTGPGSNSSGSKNGSVKYLADMYSIGADSGISANGKSSNGAKRVTVSNEQLNGIGCANNTNASNNNNSSSNSSDNGGSGRFGTNQNAARMYHYQHQKQQMIISDRSLNGRHTSASDLDSEDENDEGSYTVYECPGLASAHEMEIKNPLFNDDQTP